MFKDDLPKSNPADRDEALLPPEKQLPDYKEQPISHSCRSDGVCKCEQPTAEQSSLVQEPVAYFKKWEDKSGEHKDIKFSNSEGYKPLYTHPAPSWQELSDDEIWNIANFLGKNKEWDYPVMFAKTIEKALKEKNNV